MSGVGRASSSASYNFRGAFAPRLLLKDHCAAVKAVSWCPFQNHTLASGGGTADRNIRMWNTATGACTHAVDTGSQVCALQWSDHNKELVSSHGFSDNQLILWKFPTMTKIKEFKGHTARVLHLAKSPDGSTICSGSVDETLRFWNIFDAAKTSQSSSLIGSGSKFVGMSTQIR
jgi:cell division cycle protein 20 (cofactor of APC complex)